MKKLVLLLVLLILRPLGATQNAKMNKYIGMAILVSSSLCRSTVQKKVENKDKRTESDIIRLSVKTQ